VFLLVLKIGTVSIFQSLDQTMECCAHIPLNCAMSGPRSASQVDERIHRKWRGDKKLEGDREDKERKEGTNGGEAREEEC
jgi:hypothetical protein